MTLTCDNKMMVAAHRGDSYSYYENTMEAFLTAIEEGADMIETDVHLTRDLVPVLIHDDTVDRTTDGTGYICDLTYEELCSLNAGGIHDIQRIPTLDDFLKLISTKNILLNLEIKEYYKTGNEERCELCIDKCVSLIEKYSYADKMVFNSFDAHVLEYLADQYNGKYMLHGFYPYTAMFNVQRDPDEYLYCACISDNRNKAHYEHLCSKGIEPWIGASVTGTKHLQECYELGARLITTNFPSDCLRRLDNIGAR